MIRVAIDGPAGAGKSTVAREVARRIGATFVDTGAMYRALALAVLAAGADPHDEDAVRGVLERTRITLEPGCVRVDGRDVTEEIRSADVTAAVSRVSAHPSVREAFVAQQRAAAEGDIVMEGRDIGTVVLPDADVKIFLTASLEERARRRALDVEQAGGTPALGEVRQDIEVRDRRDSTRAASPLVPAADSVTLDTTSLTFDEVVQRIVDLVESAGETR